MNPVQTVTQDMVVDMDKAAKRRTGTQVMTNTLFTIGYEGLDIDQFLTELREAGVKSIADVRALPISRKRGFSKSRLTEHLASAGLDYRHFVDLGDPKQGREAARAGRYDDFERIYAAHLATSSARSALADLAKYSGAQATCLLCFERDPTFCHRSRVASALLGSGFAVRNLLSKPDVRLSSISARRDAREGVAATQCEAW